MVLSVNIDHVATLRQARRGLVPDPVVGAKEALRAGADGITFHLREDRRHIQDEDVYKMKEEIKAPLNFEGALYPEIIDIMLDVHPYEVTLVPEKREEVTTEGGLDVIGAKENLIREIPRFKEKGIVVSLFVDPDEEQIKAAREVGADAIEIHTGAYANASGEEQQRLLQQIKEMVAFGKEQGLIVNAGHGLDFQNTSPIANIKEIYELNIGHSIISESIFSGLYQAVKDMVQIVKG